jgi:signal transduction histidine kinase
VTGCTRDVLIGTDFSNYCSDPELARVGYLRVFKEGHVRDYPLNVRHCSGYVTPVLYNATLYHNEKGEVSGIFAAARDITVQKRAEEEVRASHEQLRAFAGRLQAVREEERTRIAREIHDELGGALTSLKIDFSLLKRTASKVRDTTLRDSLHDGMGDMTNLINATMRTVRRIATELRPGVLDDLGLVAALEWQLGDFQKRTGIHCRFLSSSEHIDLEEKEATALFRIFQETLTNAARHSGASAVCVHLHVIEDAFRLVVEDNGKGIGEAEIRNPRSLGLLGIRERATLFGGYVTITGRPDRGTTVTVEGPVKKKKDPESGGS